MKSKIKNSIQKNSQPPRYLNLQPAMVGPWITGTNKMSRTAFENYACRITGSLMDGWDEPSPFENESIRRAKALRPEALAAVDTFADMVMLPGHVFSVIDPLCSLGVAIQARPHGYSLEHHIGCTISTPCASHHLSQVDAPFTTEELWDGLAHLAMIPTATHWLAVSYSPPFLPIIKWMDRRDYPLMLQEIHDGFKHFTARIDSIIARENARFRDRKISFYPRDSTPYPIQ